MYFDALTMAAVADEMRPLEGGRVQKVVAPDALSIALEVYSDGQRRYLCASADAQQARVHLVSHKPRRGAESPSPLLLLLRKHVEGARLDSVSCPRYERVLQLGFAQGEGTVTLVIEVMGRHSNVVLVDARGEIMESVKRVGPGQSRYRLVLPRHTYVPPPPQHKTALEDLTERDVADLSAVTDPADIADWLVASVRGVSPLLAREAVARAGAAEHNQGLPRAPAALAALRDLWAPPGGRCEPSVGLADGAVVAYAPYRLTQFPEHKSAQSISAAIDEYLAAIAEADSYAGARDQVRRHLDMAADTLQRKRRALERSLARQQDAEELRAKGEAILTYASQVAPRQAALTVTGEGGQVTEIALDAALTAVENAQAYFKRYHKARAAGHEVPELLEALAEDEAYLAQLRADLELAEDRGAIDEVRLALIEAGWVRGEASRAARPKSGPLSVRSQDGTVILVGRNARQNEEVTFGRAAADDLWLHARGVPGSHVVIKAAGKPVSDETLLEAAALAAYYSQGRGEAQVAVDWTERRHVRRRHGSAHGMVHYTGEHTLRVAPSGPDLD